MEYKKELKRMFRRMQIRNICIHFTRNNFRHTNKYYYEFIGIIGADRWDDLDTMYKNEWNSARFNFDKMYGLISAWKDTGISFRDPAGENGDHTLFCIINELTRAISGLEGQSMLFDLHAPATDADCDMPEIWIDDIMQNAVIIKECVDKTMRSELNDAAMDDSEKLSESEAKLKSLIQSVNRIRHNLALYHASIQMAVQLAERYSTNQERKAGSEDS